MLIGDEPVLPYQRPPLSKSYLAGDSGLDELWLRPEAFYEKQRIDLICPAKPLPRSTGRAAACGWARAGELACDHVVLATGARNRPLPVPGAELDGVMGLRTLADADALRAAAGRGARGGRHRRRLYRPRIRLGGDRRAVPRSTSSK